ncbi:hypothetical protein NC651_033268 [Populus alba x Populus x berolinensis]|nr:hypothetical protein NC651_033268 [Populus alba x Populus x berolinensis]
MASRRRRRRVGGREGLGIQASRPVVCSFHVL